MQPQILKDIEDLQKNIGDLSVDHDHLKEDYDKHLGDFETLSQLPKVADVEIEGRTLVNLMGRAGNAIYKQLKDVDDITCSLDYNVDEFVYTKKSLSTQWLANMSSYSCMKTDRYYIGLAEVRGETDTIDINIQASYALPQKVKIGQGTTFSTAYFAVHTPKVYEGSTEGWYIDLVTDVRPENINKKRYIKNIRIYEINKEIYDKIETDPEYTGENLAEKYPYVDDIKCIMNPYIESKENLLDIPLSVGVSYHGLGFHSMEAYSDIRAAYNRKIYLVSGEKYTISSDIYNKIPGLEIRMGAFTGNESTIDHTNDILGNWGTMYDKDITFTMPQNMKFVMIAVRKTGDAKFTDAEKQILQRSKASLVKGESAIPYDQCNNSRIMFETTLYEGEKITKDIDGNYIKTFDNYKIGEKKCVGDKNRIYCEYDSDGLITSICVTCENDILYFLDFYGNILEEGDSYDARPNKIVYEKSGGDEYKIQVHSNFTGWGANYTPSNVEAIAFLLGWKMFVDDGGACGPYDGEGKKAWAKLWCGCGIKGSGKENQPNLSNTVRDSQTSQLPKHLNDMGYTPFRILYKISEKITESVKTIGELAISKHSMLTASSGLILNEGNNFEKKDGINIGINGYYSKAKHRVDNFLSVRNIKNNNIYNYKINNLLSVSDYIVNVGKQNITLPNLQNINIGDIEYDYTMIDLDTIKSFKYNIKKSNISLSKPYNNSIFQNIRQTVVSNPNLLVNGNFRVWQRGTKFSTNVLDDNKYCADRWKYYGVECIQRELDESGIYLRNSKKDRWGGISQVIPISDLPDIVGKTVTVSCKMFEPIEKSNVYLRIGLSDDIILSHCVSNNFVNMKGSSFASVSIDVSDYKYLAVWINTDFTQEHAYCLSIDYVKLEIGNTATPNIPRSYDEELKLCQRYYQKFLSNMMVDSHYVSTNYIWFKTQFNIPMRIIPTIDIVYDKLNMPNISSTTDDGTQVYTTGFEFQISSYSNSTVTISAKKENHGIFTRNHPHLSFGTDSYLTLDAEIY